MTYTPATLPSMAEIFGDAMPPDAACPRCGNTDTTHVVLIDTPFEQTRSPPEVYCYQCEGYYALSALATDAIVGALGHKGTAAASGAFSSLA